MKENVKYVMIAIFLMAMDTAKNVIPAVKNALVLGLRIALYAMMAFIITI